MRHARRMLGLALFVVMGPMGVATAKPLRIDVPATDDKRCQAYFHNTQREVRYPLVLSLRGTGVYTTSHSVESAVRHLYEAGRITVLSLDKPGITLDERRPGIAVVNDADYNRYTQEDLVSCAAHALAWAARMAPLGGPVMISAHSEGAQVAIRLLADLMQNANPLAYQIKALFLSGLPLGDWRSLLAAQLDPPGRTRFFTAFARRDDGILRRYGNLSTTYLEHVFAQEPLDATLERLAEARVTTPFYIYQGLADRNTPAAAIRAFESANAARMPDALNLTVRYYPAGHALNLRAVRDIGRDMANFLSMQGF